METKITSTSGTAKVAGFQAGFNASPDSVSLNLSVNLNMSINRTTKEVTIQIYPVQIEAIDDMTIGGLKEAMRVAVLELDLTLINQ